MTELNQEARDILTELEEKGFSHKQIIDFLNDGDALKAEGIEDKNLVEEMYCIVRELKNNEEIAAQSD